MYRALYNLAIYFYVFGIRIAAFRNIKARKWIVGRKSWEINLKNQIDEQSQYIWFHAASLGEFEQGRPLIEALKAQNNQCKILLTFFSPSGYEVRKNYPMADVVFYLPPDTPGNAKRFVKIINPKLVFFIKYEFWLNYLDVLQKQQIPHFLLSGVFRPGQIFFKWYGKFLLQKIKGFTHLFLQNESSAKLIQSFGISNLSVVGDTRFDRVWENAQRTDQIQSVEEFCRNKFIVVGGSTWPPEEEILARYMSENQTTNIKLILAPHDVSAGHIRFIQQIFNEKTILYSSGGSTLPGEARILIIDSIGILNTLYRVGSCAMVGGAFKTGLHNVLEPAAFGLPVIFGPNYHKFAEAVDLIEADGGISVNDYDSFKLILNRLMDEQSELLYRSSQAKNMVKSGVGASQKILNFIAPFI